MTLDAALMKVAKAQGALYALTKTLLKEDKHDGLAAARRCAAHQKVFDEILEWMRMEQGVDDDVIQAAQKAAGEPEDVFK
jgi:hypothetical protein